MLRSLAGDFALEAVEAADDSVKLIFDRREGKIPGAGVVDLVTAEGFFEFGESIPRMFRVFGSSDTPKVKDFCTTVFGVEDHLDEDDDSGIDFAVFVASSGVGIEASCGIIVDEGSGKWLMVKFGDVKGGKT